MFKNPNPDHLIDVRDVLVTCSCGLREQTDTNKAAEHLAGQHFARTRYGAALAFNGNPPHTVIPMLVPAGLDAVERLNYRRGYSTAFGRYLKANGTPGVQGTDLVKLRTHAAAWHAQHDEARAAAAHRSGLSAVRAYWKRHGITDRAHLIGPVRAPAKLKQVTCQHCGQLTAVA